MTKLAALARISLCVLVVFSSQAFAGKKAPKPSGAFIERKLTREGFSKSFIQDVTALYEPKDFSDVLELNVLLFLKKSDYHGIQVTSDAEKEVRKFLAENKDNFLKAEAASQVPAEVIASLMWIESRFGRNSGNFHVPSVYLHLIQGTRSAVQNYLFSRTSRFTDVKLKKKDRREIVARTHRKSDWAIEELRALEKVHQWKWQLGSSFRGSFSGAFGMPQFIPSSYVRWARAVKPSTQPDLTSSGDAIMSVAHYLSDHGWRTDVPESQVMALMKYNNSRDYANAILQLAGRINVRMAASVEAAAPKPLVLKPFKDVLFAHGKMISSSHDGLLKIFDYNEMRDINGRDEVVMTKANPKYVAPLAEDAQRSFVLDVSSKLGKRKLETYEVGRASGAKFGVIFIHGTNGTRELAVNDWTFSGNFNRLKNLTVQNDGVYYAPTVKTFDLKGSEEIAALIEHIAKVSPGAPIVLACASSGGYICSGVAKMEGTIKLMAGMMLMGTTAAANVAGTEVTKQRLPILFSQGTKDRLCPYPQQVAQFEKILKSDSNYPTAFVAFQTGGHGTPMRMIDWRESLNWIFALKAAAPAAEAASQEPSPEKN